MKKVIILLTMFTAMKSVYADNGQCYAMGRVGGEELVCAKYNNTSEEACKKADGWAFCAWKPANQIKVADCTNSDVTTADAVKAIVVNIADESVQAFLKNPESLKTVTTCQTEAATTITYNRKRFIGEKTPFQMTIEKNTDFSDRSHPQVAYKVIEFK